MSPTDPMPTCQRCKTVVKGGESYSLFGERANHGNVSICCVNLQAQLLAAQTRANRLDTDVLNTERENEGLRMQLQVAQTRAGEAEALLASATEELQALTPECTCYEFIGGHQQGCPMYPRPSWREKCEEAEAQRDLAVGALKPFAAVVEKYKDDRDVRFTGIIELTLELYPPSSSCRFDLGSVPSTVFTDADAALAALPSASAEDWQPIETAPKDGTYILVTSGSYGPYVAKYMALYRSGYAPRNPWASMMLNHDHLEKVRHVGEHVPTRWMPMPKPPIDAARSELDGIGKAE